VIRILALAALFFAQAQAVRAQSAEELQRMLKERDARIQELIRRIQALEKDRPAASEEDEELNRALERTLVQQGGMLLRAGAGELEPQLSYAHWDKSRSALRHVGEAALVFRAGLGWESQFQARVPYLHVSTASASATDFGDIELSLSRQLVRESGPVPSLVASLGWLIRTGNDAFAAEVPTGGGFNVLQAGATALKRHDPLVYYAGLSYAWPRARHIGGTEIEPGDTLGVRLGSILAASPEASVNVGLNLSFVRATRLDGKRVADSDTVLGTLQIGFGTILSRSVMLNVSGDFRVTGNVPNFRLNASLPIRF